MTRLVYARHSEPGASYWWHHYLVIEDGRVTIIEMKQALLTGMNFGRVEEQHGDEWRGMTAEQIVAWKREAGSNLQDVHPDEAARVLAWLAKQEIPA